MTTGHRLTGATRTSRTTRTTPATRPEAADDHDGASTVPGTTRFDLVCQPDIVETAAALVRRWASDRVLNVQAHRRLLTLIDAALRHGLRYNPRGLTVLLRWADPERVRVDLRWRGDQLAEQGLISDGDLEATISTLEVLADEWGVGGGRECWIHWMVVTTEHRP